MRPVYLDDARQWERGGHHGLAVAAQRHEPCNHQHAQEDRGLQPAAPSEHDAPRHHVEQHLLPLLTHKAGLGARFLGILQ